MSTTSMTVTCDPVHPAVPGAGPLPQEGGAHWYPPEGLLRRGTVVLLHGRGEHPGVYERFGRRLSADAYVVHVLDAWPDRAPAELAAAVDALAEEAPVPLVLAGSDTGALHALAAAVRTTAAPDALLLVGVPRFADDSDNGEESDGDWAGELDARTACPAHRGRLDADPLFTPGALAVPVPADLAEAAEAALATLPELPVLLLHGAADPVSPPATARALAARLPLATLATVTDGRHDTLNDLQHRSVAALTVQWLERLRGAPGPSRRPLLTLDGAPLF